MATSLQIYEAQVIQFLKSCTIVFSPMATLQNTNLTNGGIAISDNPLDYKYYLNLSGQYFLNPADPYNLISPNPLYDTMMQIQSLDSKALVDFTTSMLASNPKTQAAYTIGSSYYNNLCQKYPTQVDLIKSILYPVDAETAYNADDFTLLGWGEGYLEATEEEAIIQEINNFLTYASTAWYFPFLNYECYYTWTFWASLWQTLPNVIFAARLQNLQTSYVHSFHIWNYLMSRGISDYSDILTRQQALFLYRNINYLIENRGTQNNLIILVNNLLDSLAVGLVGKTIYMNTNTPIPTTSWQPTFTATGSPQLVPSLSSYLANSAEQCVWTPEFVSTIVPTNDSQSLTIIPPESMTQITDELYAAGLEIDDSASNIANLQTYIGNTTLNILPTKVLEIQKLGIDQKYGLVLINFIMDTWVSMVVSGLYTATLAITDPTTNIDISLDAKDALALYYYASIASEYSYPQLYTPSDPTTDRILPVNLPTIYTPSAAFQYNISEANFPETFIFNGVTYIVNDYLSIANTIEGISYPTIAIDNSDDFSEFVSNQFLLLINLIRFSRTNGNYITQKMFISFMKQYVLQTTPYTYTLSSSTTYTEWTNALNLTDLFTALNNNADPNTVWGNLGTTIISALIPWNTTVFNYFGFTPSSIDDQYDRIKELFVQLCSYNIAFLDTDRTNSWWFLSERVLAYISNQTDNLPIALDPLIALPEIIPLDTLSLNYDQLNREVSIDINDSIVFTVTDQAGPTTDSQMDTIPLSTSLLTHVAINIPNDTISIPCKHMLKSYFAGETTNDYNSAS